MKMALLFFDGGIRNGLMAYGYLAYDIKDKSKILFKGSNTCGAGSSNIAEYRALIAGLRECIKNKIKKVYIFGDSQLIIKQVNGAFKVNKQELKKHRDYILKLLEKFDDWSLQWIPRTENRKADALVCQVFEKRFPKCKRKRHSH